MDLKRPSEFRQDIAFPHASTLPGALVPVVLPAVPPVTKNLITAQRILIAEDDPVACKILANRLNKLGYETVVTRDGNEAMTVMRSANAPAVAVLDRMMPGMDGIEVCRRLREVNKAVYIIFLTSLGTKEAALQALEAGADDYLVKPFDTFALQTRIRVGLRIIALQTVLADRVNELESAATELNLMRSQLKIPL